MPLRIFKHKKKEKFISELGCGRQNIIGGRGEEEDRAETVISLRSTKRNLDGLLSEDPRFTPALCVV